jgi:hypothetical protein
MLFAKKKAASLIFGLPLGSKGSSPEKVKTVQIATMAYESRRTVRKIARKVSGLDEATL